MVQNLRHGCEPAVTRSQPTQQVLYARVHNSILHKSTCEVGVDNADPAFTFELLLICFREKIAEGIHVRAVAGAEPVLHEWLRRIVVRQSRVDTIKIDLAEDEAAHVVDVLLAQISPK